jgi:hypothetical protein
MLAPGAQCLQLPKSYQLSLLRRESFQFLWKLYQSSVELHLGIEPRCFILCTRSSFAHNMTLGLSENRGAGL